MSELELTDEHRQRLLEQAEELEQEINKVPFAKERYSICKQCDKLIFPIMVCKVCYCFMPGKTRMKSQSCPLGKWNSLNEDEVY